MNENELRNYIKNNFIHDNKLKNTLHFQKKYGELLYSFEKRGFSFLENLYIFYYRINPRQCPICGKRTKFVNFSQGYRNYCSTKCSANSPEKQKLIINTNIKKYGCSFSFQSSLAQENIKKYRNKLKNKNYNKEVIEKRIKTINKKYGVDFIGQSADIKNKIKSTLQIKYGVDHYSKTKEYKLKIKKTSQKIYGIDSPLSSPLIRNKIQQTNLQKYGVVCALHNKEIEEKIKNTNLKKYGVSNPFQSESIKEKIKHTNLIKYGSEYANQNKTIIFKIKQSKFKQFYEKLLLSDRFSSLIMPLFTLESYYGSDGIYPWQCKKCNQIFNDTLYKGRIPRCPTCFPLMGGNSQLQKEIREFLAELLIPFEENIRSIISPLELDFYLPSKNFAIEFNGLFWHSELQKKDVYYHLNKTIACQKKSIQLFHIYEDEWIEKKEIIKSIIKAKLGIFNERIFARKCQIINGDSEIFENCHLQGRDYSSINIALSYNQKMVAAMSFSKSKLNKHFEWELTRFVIQSNIQVVGAFSKLLNYFIKTYQPNSIVSYADLRYSNGGVYYKNGFKLNGQSKPDYYYTDYKHRFNRRSFQKKQLKQTMPFYDQELTEWQNMQLNGWDRIWDCGNLRFIWTR